MIFKKKKKGYRVIVAMTPEEVREAVALALKQEVVGLDTETTGCDPRVESPVYKANAFSVQIAWGNTAYFIPTFAIEGVCDFSHLIEELIPLVESDVPRLTYHSAKYDLHVLANKGLIPDPNSLLGDTLVMSYTYNNGFDRHGLKECAKRELGKDTVEFRESFQVPKLKKNGEPGKVMRLPDLLEAALGNPVYPERAKAFRGKLSGAREGARRIQERVPELNLDALELIISYASLDPLYTAELYLVYREKLKAMPWADGKSMMDFYNTIPRRYTTTLFGIERRGIPISKKRLLVAQEKCHEDIRDTLKEFNHLAVKAGASIERMKTFNTGSNKDIAWLFSEVLGVKAAKKKRASGEVTESWDADSLRDIRSPKAKPLADCLLKYRNAQKILGTYIEPFLKFHGEYKGHLHTTFKQTGAITGRLSSAAPNLQTAPKGSIDPYGLRYVFVADSDQHEDGFVAEDDPTVMGDIDLSQVEMRIAAHISQDPTLLKAIRNDWDIHSLTAIGVFPEVREFVGARTITAALLKEVKEKFPEQRSGGKTLNFGVLFGMSGKLYAATTGCTEQEGYAAVEAFYSTYPGIKACTKKTVAKARSTGYVRTLLKRYVRIPNINSEVMRLRSGAERLSFNVRPQGGCADMMMLAMIKIENDPFLQNYDARVRLQIHDELIFTMPKSKFGKAKKLIEYYMSHPFEAWGFAPLTVDTPGELSGPALCWAEAKDLCRRH